MFRKKNKKDSLTPQSEFLLQDEVMKEDNYDSYLRPILHDLEEWEQPRKLSNWKALLRLHWPFSWPFLFSVRGSIIRGLFSLEWIIVYPLNPKLKEIAKEYISAKQRIVALEDKTALSALTPKTINDLRDILDHLLSGIAITENPNSKTEKIETQYDDALSHIRHYTPNAFQIIAGKKLRETQIKIDEARPFSKIGRAKNIYEEAVSHYTRGREKRTLDPESALNAFEKAAELAQEAARFIEPATTGEKFIVWGTVILALVNIFFLVKIFWIKWSTISKSCKILRV